MNSKNSPSIPLSPDDDPGSVLELGALGASVRVTAEQDGWWLRPRSEETTDLSRRTGWPADALAMSEGKRAGSQVELLLDLDIAETAKGAVVIRWERFSDLFKEEIHLPLDWTSSCPLMLAIDRVSELGQPDFRYRYNYRSGARDVSVQRVGYFLRRSASRQIYHLDEQTFALVDAMDQFNALSRDEKSREATWLTFGLVKNCSASVGAALDRHLRDNDVVIPSQIALDIYVHPEDRASVSFVPSIEGVSDAGFRAAFLRNKDAEGLYSVDEGDGRRVRVVLNERQKDVLRRMKAVTRVSGAARVEVERDPAQCFEGLRDSVTIYGPRVIGVGDYPFARVPSSNIEGGGFFELPERMLEGTSISVGEPPIKPRPDRPISIKLPGLITSSDADIGRDEGHSLVHLRFNNRQELELARALMAEAVARGQASVIVNGQTVAATAESSAALGAAPIEMGGARVRGKMYLLVYTNQEDLQEEDALAAGRASLRPDQWAELPIRPASLRLDVSLKPHQLEALLWLQRCGDIVDRRGVLLADDMGLGKTLQVLAYLAWRIERGGLKINPAQHVDASPFRPILIVAPLILVENETWQLEMRKFFKDDGNIFEPTLVLHGNGIEAVKSQGAKGSETAVGKPLLDADKLMQYRVVITNYETVVNYQHSLAQLKHGRPIWSVVVTDEAQKYKALDTQLALALKAITADFHIAGTGTPVENRLLDLWNIVDTIQPALLGSVSDFTRKYEQRVDGQQDAEDAANALSELRNALLYGQSHAFLVRRTKRDANLGLPPKTSRRLECLMSDTERALHLELLRSLSRETKGGMHMQVLHKLARLYQHPALLRDWTQSKTQDLIAESSKLQSVLRILHEIQGRREKVIIFARHHDAQQLLQQVLEREFGIIVPIVNGTTSRGSGFHASSGATQRARNSRKSTLDLFKQQEGFGAIILSPFVAGIGLTIVEANHVMHYGRWWNPAVENQATDRAYRIGQTREVFVHLPILHDSTGVIPLTFDERLDALIARKTALADNFLLPMPSEEDNAAELSESILQDAKGMRLGDSSPFSAADIDGLAPHDFEAVVAALYRAEGYETILTARGGDGGADVLALRRSGEGKLIQVKHSAARAAVDSRALNDIIAAIDVYGNQVRARWKAMVVSNSPMAPEMIREAQTAGVELLSGDSLMRRLVERRVGLGAMTECALERCASFEEGVGRARKIFAG